MDVRSGSVITVRVIPNASVSEVIGYDEIRKEWKVKINAPPDKGKANAELTLLLKKECGLAAAIVSGHTSRIKRLRIL